MWTLVGGGEKSLQDSAKPTSKLMPRNTRWIKAGVEQFDPKENMVYASGNVKVYPLSMYRGVEFDTDFVTGFI